MNHLRPILLFLLLSGSFCLTAQDKLVFKDGKKTICKIVAINPHSITYRDSTSGDHLITVPKNDVLMAEYKSGSVYIFGNEEAPKPAGTAAAPVIPGTSPVSDRKKAWREKEAGFKDNIIGVQLPDLVFGRLTVTYERLFLEKQLGITVPASLTYDPRALLIGASSSPTAAASPVTINRGVNFITGLDANFYFETRGHTKFFVGPRFRYGTDMSLDVTAYSVQYQNGFFFPSSSGRMANTLALGFGFVRIIATGGGGINPNQSYPWMSFTYRLGFRL